MNQTKTHRLYQWIGDHAKAVVFGALIVALTLGIVGPLVADTNDANFDPSGEVYDTMYEVRDTLVGDSPVRTQTWLVEASDPDGNVLTQAALAEWLGLTTDVRNSEKYAAHLVDQYDPDTGTTVPGIMSIADVANAYLGGQLGSASSEQTAQALDEALAQGSPMADMRFTLSEKATVDAAGWSSPAFLTTVVYDSSGFETVAEEEQWLRDMQADLRDGAVLTSSIGITIDPELVFGEAGAQAAPFIFLAVALIILLVSVVHRSYWSAVVVGSGLAATSLAAYGTSALLGLKMGSVLLAFIVPIAMISFGVDFYIHGVGRVREVQVESGLDGRRAYPFGMTAVFTALLLAVMSSVAAFMANAASGTEAIIQFGIGSAISLIWAYILLGQISPRATVGVEEYLGADPVKRWSKVPYALGMLVTAVAGGLAVALAAVMPTAGVVALVAFVLVFVLVPIGITRRRNRRAIVNDKQLVEGHTGAAHGLRPAGSIVEFLARWRYVTIPVVIVVAVLGFMRATTVGSGFDIEDMLSSDTDFAQSIVRITDHFPSSGEGSSFIYVTGDLTDPANLAALDDIAPTLDASDAGFGRRTQGELIVGLHAADVVRMVMASPAAVEIEASGPSLADADGNGLPDSKAGVAAVLRHALTYGVQTPEGAVAIPVADVPTIVTEHDSGYATAVVIQVGSWTDGAVIEPVEAELVGAAEAYESATTDTRARVSGEVIASYHGMNAFTRSMIVSLPLALGLALLIASVMLRSVKFALVSVLPIGLVVIGVYAFMATFGYTVNVVTATIAAVAVGVGIDFSTHFTARYREEHTTTGDRLEAARRAGVGTGGALTISALTSVMGFLVMALAPTPMFATFGILTAVMVVLSLLVAVLVLPSILVLVTPSRTSVLDVEADVVVEPVPA